MNCISNIYTRFCRVNHHELCAKYLFQVLPSETLFVTLEIMNPIQFLFMRVIKVSYSILSFTFLFHHSRLISDSDIATSNFPSMRVRSILTCDKFIETSNHFHIEMKKSIDSFARNVVWCEKTLDEKEYSLPLR